MSTTLSKLKLIIGLTVLSVTANAATVADILVWPASEVASADVKLADIATVKCADKALAGRLREAVICPAPLAGRTQSITRNQILTALRRQGLADNTAGLLSPNQVSVTRSSFVVTGEALFQTAREFILGKNLYPGATVEVEPVRAPANQIAPKGSTEIRIGERVQSIHKGRNTLPVEVVVDGKVYICQHVTVTVRVFGNILIASKPISKLGELNADNTSVQDCEITYLSEDLVSALPETAVVAGTAIAEGAQIRRGWISEPPVVRAGDIVIVAAVGDSIRVTDRGTAVTDGRPGERIKVRLGKDSREVRGVVTGPGLVEIRI